MVRRCIDSFWVLMLFFLVGCNIEGRITTYDGQPMAGVKVILGGDASLTTRTDSDGYYMFTDLTSGRYTVKPIVTKYRCNPASQVVTIGEDDIYGIDFELEPGNHIRVPRDYDTLQEAVDKASDGDFILVSDGVYSGFGNHDIVVSKWITIRSENGPQNCIIDCQKNGRGFLLAADVTLTGFTITNGAQTRGGAILSAEGASPKISNCIIKGNYALEAGGGIDLAGGYPRIIGCTIIDNKTDHDGGGLSFNAGQPSVSGSTISNNDARYGGGIFGVEATAILKDSIVRDNHALEQGGGWYSYDSSQEIDRAMIYGNTAGDTGAGLFLNYGTSTIRHATIADNDAAGSGGVTVGMGRHVITHSILYGNTVEQLSIDVNADFTVSHAIVGQEDIQGECVTHTDPKFVDDEYYLLESSPCESAPN